MQLFNHLVENRFLFLPGRALGQNFLIYWYVGSAQVSFHILEKSQTLVYHHYQ